MSPTLNRCAADPDLSGAQALVALRWNEVYRSIVGVED